MHEWCEHSGLWLARTLADLKMNTEAAPAAVTNQVNPVPRKRRTLRWFSSNSRNRLLPSRHWMIGDWSRNINEQKNDRRSSSPLLFSSLLLDSIVCVYQYQCKCESTFYFSSPDIGRTIEPTGINEENRRNNRRRKEKRLSILIVQQQAQRRNEWEFLTARFEYTLGRVQECRRSCKCATSNFPSSSSLVFHSF